MSIDYKEALRLKRDGMRIKGIMKRLGINNMKVDTFNHQLARLEKKCNTETNTIEGMAEATDIKSNLMKLLEKGGTIEELGEISRLSTRVVMAHIEDLNDAGYNITEIDGTYKLLKAIVPQQNEYKVDWNGEKVIRFGGVSDTHFCNKWQQLTFLNYLYDIFEREGITKVYHAGDISDGFYKNRPGHIYELIPGLIGVDAQADYIIDKYPYREGITTEYITGNHDDTHIMNGGANIGKMIARDRPDMVYLGMNNAKIHLTPNCILEVNHPTDGAAYALSYTLQKLIDAMMGGEKPNILLNGHHHKVMYLFYRNIHAFEMGTTEAQTPWMKGKKLAAMCGGWIIEIHVDKEGTITRCKYELIPLYKPIENDY